MEDKRTEPIIATYLHQKGSKLGLPISGNFELTARCNFNCPMCYVHLSKDEIDKRGRELSAEKWIEIASEAKNAGMMFALLTGGEPLIRDDFFEIYNAMKAMGLMISINTNGSLIKGEVLQKLLDNPPFRMNITLYGASRETYRNMCGADAFEQVIDGIRHLKEAGVDVRLNLSLIPFNINDMDLIYALSQELSVHIKCSTYMYPFHRKEKTKESSDARFSPEKAAEYAIKWEKLRVDEELFNQRCRSIVDLSSIENDICTVDSDEGISCRAGRSSFWITWDGKMMPCGMMTFPSYDVLEYGFNDSWERIKAASKVINEPLKCKTCELRKVCNHCAAVCVTETGSFSEAPEYMCRYSESFVLQAKHFLNEV